jgi:tRNA-dihydrouridine synthase B
MLKTPFHLGSFELPSNIFCAPLAGCSDLPFRRMLSKYKPGLMYCEMVKMEALLYNKLKTIPLLDKDDHLRPIGAQLVGSNPKLAAECAKIIEDLGFDVLDLNCGCPVDKVTKDGSGSGLLKNPEVIGEIVSNMVSAVKIPVTVKIRAGWDSTSIVSDQVTKIAEASGASAICIHGRTRAQAYRGNANWDYIKIAKEAANKIKVIGNGDVFNPESAKKMFEYTGCDAILLARGTMGQPWLIEDIYDYLSGKDVRYRSPIEGRDIFLEHLEHIVSYKPLEKAHLDLRRVGCWFLKNIRGAKALRESINRSSSIDSIRKMIEDYPWESCEIIPMEAKEETSDCC